MEFLQKTFKNLPIQRKIGLAILLTCATALTVAVLAILLVQIAAFRQTFARDLEATGQIIGNNSTAALIFKDRNTAAEILSAVKAKPHILQGFIELPDGSEFAAIKTVEVPETIRRPRTDGSHFVSGYLVLSRPILLARERIGTLYLVSDYRSGYRAWLQVCAAVLGAVLMISVLLALLLANRLQRLISSPILGLAKVAQDIAQKHDYSVRAEKVAEDEVGHLTDAFNEMLAKTEHADATLRRTNEALEREIAERKQTEQKIEKLHKELMVTSRQAGMAEVATGVLHNVGNVLNSVNVSVTVVNERLRKFSTGALAKVCSLLEQHHADLGTFITEDPKGKRLPQFLAELSRLQNEETDQIAAELQSLTKNIQHVKEIVAMQQSYAKLAGVVEDLSSTELVEDALRMNAAALQRHGITLQRDYHEAPLVRVDKHKVLQILVNLLRNAKYAMEASRQPEKILRISTARPEPERVTISVIDNGIGISPENLTRIFNLGFTTKRDGHGFGLHGGALAAKEMGGSLRAFSQGPGTGATFILELPAAQPNGTHHE